MAPESSGREALDELYWRTEILQALYWMHGEGLGDEVSAATLAEFLAAEPVVATHHMERLVAGGYLEAAPRSQPARYRLTALGLSEGARSFQEEFADYLHQGHLECGPGCWCKDPKHAGEPCPRRAEVPHGA